MILSPYIKQHFDDDNGKPLAGGTVETYVAGSETPISTYQNAEGSTLNETTIDLDSRGECNIYLDQDLSYKYIVRDKNGKLIHTVDNINSSSTEYDTYIVGSTPLDSDWLSFTDGGEALTPIAGNNYIVLTDGDYQGVTYRYDNENDKYVAIKGEQGIQGEQGEQGIQGIQGEKGDTGVGTFVRTFENTNQDVNFLVTLANPTNNPNSSVAIQSYTGKIIEADEVHVYTTIIEIGFIETLPDGVFIAIIQGEDLS